MYVHVRYFGIDRSKVVTDYFLFNRLNPTHLFECFCEVAAPAPGDPSGSSKPWILQKFPEKFNNDELLKSMPDFVFPCDFDKLVRRIERDTHPDISEICE
jgi:hypothetical protein